MPTPSFVPVIGSSFDSIAAQQAGWAGFNQRQDEANLARMQQAEQAQNQWFSRLAELQQHQAGLQDMASQQAAQAARQAQNDQTTSRQYAAQSVELRRQSDLEQSNKERQFGLNEKALQREKDTTVDFATHLQPLLTEAGTAFEDANDEYSKISTAFQKRINAAESMAGFPGTKVQLSKATGQYEVKNDLMLRKPYDLSPAEADVVKSANSSISSVASDMLLAQHKLGLASADWKAKQEQVGRIGGVPIKVGKTWLLRVPALGKTFGKMVEEAKIPWSGFDATGAFGRPSPENMVEARKYPTVSSLEEFRQLPPGTIFISGDGMTRRKTENGTMEFYTPPPIPDIKPPTSQLAPATANSGTAPFIPQPSGENYAKYAGARVGLSTVLPGLSAGLLSGYGRTSPVTQFVPPPTGTALSPSSPPIVTTKAQFDALPPGTLYIGPTGKKAVKK